ncbi:DUF5133 domain-containing protein [Streptomyces sp. NPDC057424]|uniref:DUF5133 domain-containing protein n=1 Tax=Streptomyces sp. NPDC057424 TaxID=3346127 RepID=UPI00368DDB96
MPAWGRRHAARPCHRLQMRQAPATATVWVTRLVRTSYTGRMPVMITAPPSLLRELVERCETLRHRLAADDGPETARRLEDATYTLCVITGTRQLDTALHVARRQLAEATRRERSLRH